MCGITAIFGYGAGAPRVKREELDRLKVSMHKRGPDGSGEWINPAGAVGLAHSRLAVIDLSAAAAQPFSSDDRSTVITFNGEIYNYLELRRILIRKGHRFRTDSDTEVLLAMYREYGADMLSRIQGMFAFAIWDESASTLFCARDLYGIKPLYYSDDGKTLRLASQVRTLRQSGIDSNERDPAGLAGFYLFGHVPEPFTLYRSIRALPAGATLTLKVGRRPEIQRYARVGDIYRQAPSTDLRNGVDLETIEQALADSVKRHTVSDVPVGLFLSAGIDSGIILSLLARSGFDGIRAVTVSFPEYEGSEDDEAPMAARIAESCGAAHQSVVIEESEARNAVPAFAAAMDQPSIDGMNTWLISRAASQAGLKVVLSGVGGDELFGGYPSFKDIPRWQRYLGATKRMPGVNKFIGAVLKSISSMGLPLNPKIAALPGLACTWPGAYLVRRGLFMPWELEQVLGKELATAGMEALQPLSLIGSEIDPDPGGAFERTATLESGLYMKNQLLRDTDWASMDHSLEVRTPLVDRQLLTDVAPVLKGRAGKDTKTKIAKKVGAGLPPSWAVREKTGFTVPIQKWLESIGDLDAWRRVPLLRSGGCHWSRRWAYTVISSFTVGAA